VFKHFSSRFMWDFSFIKEAPACEDLDNR